jgi:hypothetical protein
MRRSSVPTHLLGAQSPSPPVMPLPALPQVPPPRPAHAQPASAVAMPNRHTDRFHRYFAAVNQGPQPRVVNSSARRSLFQADQAQPNQPAPAARPSLPATIFSTGLAAAQAAIATVVHVTAQYTGTIRAQIEQVRAARRAAHVQQERRARRRVTQQATSHRVPTASLSVPITYPVQRAPTVNTSGKHFF